MKLKDLFREDITDLIESLDSYYEYDLKKSSMQQKIYRIEEPKLTVEILFDKFDNKKLAEISFKSDESQYALLNTFNAKQSLKIFGSLFKIIKEQNVDIWYYGAKADFDDEYGHQKRVQFYNRLTKRLSHDLNLIPTSRVFRGDTIYILAKEPIENSDIISYITK